MSYATKQDIKEVVDKAVEDLSEVIANFAHQVDGRFTGLENSGRLRDKKLDHLIGVIDSFVGRLDKYEAEMAARDSQFEKLLVWARKVSEKTGIPLENL